MKKIIVSILALACGVCAYAKTLDELVAEIPHGDSANKDSWKLRVEYTQANRADFEREFGVYLASAIATKNNEDLSEADRKIRSAMTPFYALYGETLTVPDAAAIRLSPRVFFQIAGVSKYNEIKDAGWKVDGKKISERIAFDYARAANDTDYMASITLAKARQMGVLITWIDYKISALYAAKDRVAALDEATEMELELCAIKDKSAAVQQALSRLKELNESLYITVLHKNKLK